MDEEQYHSTYHQINQIQCAFEKTILSGRGTCSLSHKFCLAEREGISCQKEDSQKRCNQFLRKSREKALFVFKLAQFDGVLPHAKEIRVQLGSLIGLQGLLDYSKIENIEDIDSLLKQAEVKYGNLATIPFDTLIRAINQVQGRKRRSKT